MVETINLVSYEISNAVAAESTSPDKYLISVDPNEQNKQFKIPNKLAKTYTIVQLGDKNNKRRR